MILIVGLLWWIGGWEVALLCLLPLLGLQGVALLTRRG